MILHATKLARHYNGASILLKRNNVKKYHCLFSTSSTNEKGCGGNRLVDTRIENGGTVASLILNRPPANSLSMELCTDISSVLKQLESNKKIQALVFSSSNPSILSAGIDFTELYNPNDERLPKFWYSFQQLFLDLYGSRLAIVGAIEGHAPAGGCMLAMACDYRVMAASSSEGKSSGMIGLNESQFGIVAPPFMAQLMLRTVGFREGEKALSLGKLYSSEEALEIGLVDDIVDRDLVLDASLKKATEFAKVPSHARFGSKMLARKPFIDDLIATRDEDVSNFCNFVKNDGVQKGLGAYLDKLKQKK